MFIVAIAKYASNADSELPCLAADLGQTVFDARLLLSPGLPAIVLSTKDKDAAVSLLAKLKSRGNEAVAFDSDAVVHSPNMIQIHRFSFNPDSLCLDSSSLIPYSDILAVVRASHESRVSTTQDEKIKSFSATRSFLSGGLIPNKTITVSKTHHSSDRQDVLYIFRKARQTPLFLAASQARYTGLGERMAPTEYANFLTTVELIRQHAPQAPYDDRLVSRKIPERICQTIFQGTQSHSKVISSNDSGMDLFAHLIALCLVKGPSRQ